MSPELLLLVITIESLFVVVVEGGASALLQLVEGIIDDDDEADDEDDVDDIASVVPDIATTDVKSFCVIFLTSFLNTDVVKVTDDGGDVDDGL